MIYSQLNVIAKEKAIEEYCKAMQINKIDFLDRARNQCKIVNHLEKYNSDIFDINGSLKTKNNEQVD